jgi:tetratricopeptide (TPR) repeat protein
MIRVLAATWLLGLLASICPADLLELTDGRTFTGKVTEDGDTVSIRVPYGTLRFSRSEVARIERQKTPAENLDRTLAQIKKNNIAALLEAAEFAANNGLQKRAAEIYQQVLQLAPDNSQARSALGFARLDEKWVPLAKGLEIARSKLTAGKAALLLKDVVPALELGAHTDGHKAAVAEIKGTALLREGEFADACEVFTAGAKIATGARAHRLSAIAEILEENDDGMYVLSQSFPASSSLLSDDDRQTVPAGPASLKRERVLAAALWEVAKKHVDTGAEHMSAARRTEKTDPEAAKPKYKKAIEQFDVADALVPDISRTYRVEIARRRIKSLRNDIDIDAQAFDDLKKKLGEKSMTAKAYRTTVLKLVHRLNNIRDGLKEIVAVATPYERDLVLEIKWAQADTKKTDQLRSVLMEELKDD